MNQVGPNSQEELLREKGQLREYEFSSTTPVVGGLIARFRAAWNSIATRWYVRPLIAQQTEFNQEVLNYVLPRLANYDQHLRYFEENLPRFDELDARLIAQDQQQVNTTHDLGEVVARLVQLDRRLADVEERLGRIETERLRD